jgi:hypothetical protein
MKSRTIILGIFYAAAIFCMSFSPDQSNRSPRNIMNHYRGEKGFFSFSVPMFMARAFITREDQVVKDALRDIRKVRLLVCDEACSNPGAIRDCIHDFSEYFRESDYVEIMQIKDGDETVLFQALPDENGFRNLVMIVSGGDDFVVIHLAGSIDMEKLKKLMDEDQI